MDAAGGRGCAGDYGARRLSMNRMRRVLGLLGFAIAVAAAAPGCFVEARGHARYSGGAVATYEAPPPPREEQVEMRPGYVWIQGRWDWRGGQWVWVDGRWEAQRSGYEWQQGSWIQSDN